MIQITHTHNTYTQNKLWVYVYVEAGITVMEAHTSDVNEVSCVRRYTNTLVISCGKIVTANN